MQNTYTLGAQFARIPRTLVLLIAICAVAFVAVLDVRAQINEGFENVAGLPAAGWFSVNRSSPLGASTWSQCGGTAIPPAQAGTANSCILVNFNSTTGTGTISNWLVAPTVTLNNGDTFSFYTRSPSTQFPDRLQVRLSTSGSSTDVGTTATSVGVFTNLLLDINPTYGANYPTTWTQFTVTVSGLSGPTSGRLALRYFVENGGPNGSNSNIIGVDTFVYTPAPAPSSGNGRADFDGDGRTDVSVFRGSEGRWYLNRSTAGYSVIHWGLAGDALAPADYDGDGKDDVAVYRGNDNPSDADIYILNSATSTLRAVQWGSTGDLPAVADYDGDGKADIAVFRPSDGTWYILKSTDGGNIIVVNPGTTPVPGDYDGDGKADAIVFSNGNWTGTLSGGGTLASSFGEAADIPVAGDYDGDSEVDLAVFRPSNGHWYILQSSNSQTREVPFGLATDIPAPGDYDGDGSDDIAIYRNGAWWINGSTAGVSVVNFGLAADRPVPAAARP